jgi:putative flippase GtrA
MGLPLPPFARLSRFAIVGVVAFIIDAGVLWLGIRYFNLGLYVGRAVSFLTAATAAWSLNRLFTFSDRPTLGGTKQWMAYVSASLLGAVVNYGTYCLVIQALFNSSLAPTIGVAAGSIAGFGVNFTVFSRLVFPAAATRQGKKA